jgi:dATP pyrophosphohydrolase
MPYVEVYPFRFRENRLEYLFLRRADHEAKYPGTWQIITGTREEHESAVDAAKRELKEETGLSPLRMWTVPSVGSFHDPRTDNVNMLALFAVQVGDEWEPNVSQEHSAFQWADERRGSALLVWPAQRAALSMVHSLIATGSQTALWSRLKSHE